MMKRENQSLCLFFSRFFVFSLVVLLTTSVACAETIATFKVVAGAVDVMKGGKLPAVAAIVNASLSTGDFVRTKSGGYAEVVYRDGTLLKIAQRSRVDIGEQIGTEKKESSNVRLVRGKLQAVVVPAETQKGGAVSVGKRFEIHTPNAVAGVRGTDFIVTYQRDITEVLVKIGTVYTYNPLFPDRVVNLSPATITSIMSGSAPLPARSASKSEMERFELDIAPQSSSSPRDPTGSVLPQRSLPPVSGTYLPVLPPLPPPPPPPPLPASTKIDVGVKF